MEGRTNKKRRISPRGILSLIFILSGLALLGYYVAVNWVPKWYREWTYRENLDLSLPTVSDLSLLPEDQFIEDNYARYVYPTDSFFISNTRKEYQSGEMILRVPRLAYEGEVLNGTDQWTLSQGVGLYQYSALPSYGNPNVSIAGHRGVYGAEFYNIDKFEEGDLLYLEYDGFLFTYEYLETVTVSVDDWSMLYCTDYSAITLTSCLMDGDTERICVRGKLLKAEPLEEDAEAASASNADAAQAG